MASRKELQSKLEELLGSRNVYYQAPSKMEYPCIKYSKKKPDTKHANNNIYSRFNCYELIVIDRKPDNKVIEKLLELPYCTYDRYYTKDNLNHDVLTIYF